MKLDSYKEVKEITKKLVAIESINKKEFGETNIAKAIESYYRKLDYFKKKS